MTRRSLVVLVALLTGLPPAVARAQEVVGAGRVEIGTAILGGGMVFMPQPANGESRSRSYAASGAVTVNFTSRFGVEGDVGLALGRRESMDIYGTAPADQRTPNILMYSADLVFNPLRRERHLIPYLDAGIGAWTVFGGAEASSPLAAHRTYPAFNAGGGVRWLPIAHWGVRADYRYTAIRDAAAASGVVKFPNAHRIYAGLMLTF